MRNFRAIRINYLGSWFPIDLLSIIPFDLIAILANSDSLEGLKIIRIIRLLRLLKLARIFKASRIFKRLESTLSVSFSVIGLIKFATILLVMGHWMACAWCMVGGGVASQTEEGEKWRGAARSGATRMCLSSVEIVPLSLLTIILTSY